MFRIRTHATALRSDPYKIGHIPCGNQSKPRFSFPLFEYSWTIRFNFQHIKEITQLVEHNTKFGPN